MANFDNNNYGAQPFAVSTPPRPSSRAARRSVSGIKSNPHDPSETAPADAEVTQGTFFLGTPEQVHAFKAELPPARGRMVSYEQYEADVRTAPRGHEHASAKVMSAAPNGAVWIGKGHSHGTDTVAHGSFFKSDAEMSAKPKTTRPLLKPGF